MKTFFYNLSGGINQAATKTELGLDNKILYWADSKNIEILQNKGIIRQKGNTKLAALEPSEKIIAIHQLKNTQAPDLLIATESGKLFVYKNLTQSFIQLSKTIDGNGRLTFIDFLDGVLCAGENNALFYINNDDNYLIEECGLKDKNGNEIKSEAIGVYKGRVWVGSGSTLYFSALGSYNDFTKEGDAGYINNFHTDTNDITALATYKDYLAIYKENSVFLLSGSSPEDFSISAFADKGTTSAKGVVSVNNKQYFINQGIFSMEQAGLLSQIQLGEEISLRIKEEFNFFDRTRSNEIIAIDYAARNQIWYFIPYKNKAHLSTIWIYDYVNQAWLKRVLPQEISTAAIFGDYIITADTEGKVFIEDNGVSFDGRPIDFMWKSPFLNFGDSSVGKNIESFYFILDESHDNKFNFSVYKNYDSEYKDDQDTIYSSNLKNLIWYGEELNFEMNFYWSFEDGDENETDTSKTALWAIGADALYKAEISEVNYSIQLCIEGNELDENAAIIAFEFKEVYLEE